MRSLKIQTALIFFVLLAIGMTLVELVAMRLWQQQALSADLEHAQTLLQMMSGLSESERERFIAEPDRIPGKDGAVLCLASLTGKETLPRLSPGCKEFTATLESALREASTTAKESSRFLGQPSGDPGSPGRIVLLAQPAQPSGAVAMVRTMAPLHKMLWENQGLILAYVVANATVLAVVGLFRMLRLVMRPLEHLVEQADSYSIRHDFLPFPGRGGNEFSRLSSSLNRMTAQIEEDRSQLLQKVAALRKANEELAQNRRAMVRTEKMASIGRLAAGLAHEIGNPLGVVRGYLDLLGQEGVSAGERREFSSRADRELTRVSKLIRQLLDFARPTGGHLAPVRLQELLTASVELFRGGGSRPLPEFSLITNAGNELVLADPDGLRQVLVNCFLNAVDALDGQPGGRITVQCRADHPEDAMATMRIVITDNGPGIAPEHLETIFEPFFTTKEPGRGTGLGLAVSCALIEKWGGSMWAESNGDAGGAAIHIRLPLAPTA